MNRAYWSNIRNQRTPAPTPQQAQPAPQQGLGIRRPQGWDGDTYTDPNGQSYDMSKASVFDLDLGKFFSDMSEQQNNSIKDTIRQMRQADAEDTARTVQEIYGPGYGTVVDSQPAQEFFPEV